MLSEERQVALLDLTDQHVASLHSMTARENYDVWVEVFCEASDTILCLWIQASVVLRLLRYHGVVVELDADHVLASLSFVHWRSSSSINSLALIEELIYL